MTTDTECAAERRTAGLVPFSPLDAQIKAGISTSEAAEALWGESHTFDTALPQDYVGAAYQCGMDLRHHAVWGYPRGICAAGSLSGYPLPVTLEGALMVARLAAVGLSLIAAP